MTDLEKFIYAQLYNYGVVEIDKTVSIVAGVIKAYNKSLIESLGEAISDNEYSLKPDENGQWWLTHKHVGSGEPFEQFLNS